MIRWLLCVTMVVACGRSPAATAPVVTEPTPCDTAATPPIAPAAEPAEPTAGTAALVAPAPVPQRFAGPSLVAPDQQAVLDAVLEAFPEAYPDLATVTYLHQGGEFVIESVMVLIPEARIKSLSEAELKARACAAKQTIGLDCACEMVKLEPAADWAWHSWPDKRVVPTTLLFMLAC